MPRTITVTFADGSNHVYQNAPDDVTPDVVEARATQEFGKPVASLDGGRNAAPKSLVDQIPGLAPAVSPAVSPAVKPAPEAATPTTQSDKKSGFKDFLTFANSPFGGQLIDAPATIVTGMAGGIAGGIAGAAKGLFSGKYGTPEGAQEAENTAADVAHAITRQPRTETGQYLTRKVGEFVHDSGLAGVAPLRELALLSELAQPAKVAASVAASKGATAVGNAVDNAVSTVGNKLSSLVKKEAPEMAGLGSATTADSLLRATNAQGLPIPIKLTRGQLTRDAAQQQFERETAKNNLEGKPLQDRFAEQNDLMQKNLDAFKESTGAQSYDQISTGESVVNALTGKKAAAKAKINEAYKVARASGQMEEAVDIQPLLAYLDKNEPASLNAPVLTSIKRGLKKVDPEGKGQVTINDLEELRKMTGRLSQEPGTANSKFGNDALKIMDKLTEGKGGDLYQAARGLYKDYAGEFYNQGVINKLLRNKPGTTDRAVALEDVYKHSILNGSSADVAAIKKSLLSSGDAGVQAWKDLQGQTLQHIKDVATSNAARDVNGNPIVSASKLDRLMGNVEADRKLDLVFGKSQAEQLRAFNDLSKDIYTSPPGTVNSSNTSSALLNALGVGQDMAVSNLVTGLPLPIKTLTKYVVGKHQSNKLSKRVMDAVDPADYRDIQSNALSRAATARP